MREHVERLFQKDISTYRIVKETGLHLSSVQNLRKGKTRIGDASFSTIERLYLFYVEYYGNN